MQLWYYEHLSRAEQAVYHDLYTGLTRIQPSITVTKLDMSRLSDIYFQVRMDHPEIFWTDTFRTRSYPQADSLELLPSFLFEPKKIAVHRDAMRSRVEKLARAARSLDEAARLQYVHDFICGNVHYDKLKKPYSHEIIGPLGQGVGVCEGIAKSVKVLCDALEIPCVIALSDNNPARHIRYRHTWNVVRAGGRYYHLDATFDNSLGSPDAIRYDYYLLGDKQHYRDHEPVIWSVPACPDNDAFYYRQKKLSFTKTEDVRKRIAQTMKKNRPLVFHWRGGDLTRAVLTELVEIITAEAAAAGKDADISVNRPQAVLSVVPKPLAAGSLTLQQANEGEDETPLYGEEA